MHQGYTAVNAASILRCLKGLCAVPHSPPIGSSERLQAESKILRLLSKKLRVFLLVTWRLDRCGHVPIAGALRRWPPGEGRTTKRLNVHQFLSLADAQAQLNAWRADYTISAGPTLTRQPDPE